MLSLKKKQNRKGRGEFLSLKLLWYNKITVVISQSGGKKGLVKKTKGRKGRHQVHNEGLFFIQQSNPVSYYDYYLSSFCAAQYISHYLYFKNTLLKFNLN